MILFIYMDPLDLLNKRIKQFCQDREWSQFHDPKNLALSLQLESSEVLELFQWTKDNEINPKKLLDQMLAPMYADISWCCANLGDIDRAEKDVQRAIDYLGVTIDHDDKAYSNSRIAQVLDLLERNSEAEHYRHIANESLIAH